jgi:hypothetical protein
MYVYVLDIWNDVDYGVMPICLFDEWLMRAGSMDHLIVMVIDNE